MSVHSNSSFVGPSWRPVDQTRAGLSCTPGSLLLAEVVTLRPAEKSANGDTWRLMADPGTHKLYLHLRCCDKSYSSLFFLSASLDSYILILYFLSQF